MKNMTLENIAKAVHGKLFLENGQEEKEITGVTIDSREVKNGGLFIATVGERVDGHDFIADTIRAGVLGIVCEKIPTEKCSYILVKDSLKALLLMAAYYREQLDVKVIGITGSVGKTTTKEFIAAVLSKRYRVCKTKGNQNNVVGLPLTILRIEEQDEIAVLEMGINQVGEMTKMAKTAVPDICVMTNIGQCHLELLGSLEGVLKEKSEMLSHMKMDGTLVSNGDDQLLLTIQTPKAKKQIHFGMLKENDVYATNINDQGLKGTTCTVVTKENTFDISIPLPGQHMIYNALAAVAVGELLSLTTQEISDGIKGIAAVGGRSNIIHTMKYTIIDDCYNANPVSMMVAIDMLSAVNTRKVAILGDMGELGTEEKKLHQAVGAYAGGKGLDVIICIGAFASDILEGVKSTMTNQTKIYEYPNKDLAMEAIITLLENKDTILVKASHAGKFAEIVSELEKV